MPLAPADFLAAGREDAGAGPEASPPRPAARRKRRRSAAIVRRSLFFAGRVARPFVLACHGASPKRCRQREIRKRSGRRRDRSEFVRATATGARIVTVWVCSPAVECRSQGEWRSRTPASLSSGVGEACRALKCLTKTSRADVPALGTSLRRTPPAGDRIGGIAKSLASHRQWTSTAATRGRGVTSGRQGRACRRVS